MSKIYVAQTPYLECYGGGETIHLALLGVFDSMEKAVKAISDKASKIVDRGHGEMEWWDAEGFWDKEDFTNSSRIVEMDINTSLAIFN